MPSRLAWFVVCVALLSSCVLATTRKQYKPVLNPDHLVLSVLVGSTIPFLTVMLTIGFATQESEIQKCPPVLKLSKLKNALDERESPIMRTVFAWLFPFGPAWNSILGTFYISSSAQLSLLHAFIADLSVPVSLILSLLSFLRKFIPIP